MKKLLYLTAFCCLTTLVFAQPKNRGDKDKIQELKVAFITEKLDLTVEEAQKFWPIYNQRETELRELRKARRTADKLSMDDMSDAELTKKIRSRFENQKKEVELQEKYFEDFQTAISIRKIAKLFIIEKRFKQMLLEKIRGK